MSESVEVGKVGWIDMSVDNATEVSDFYRAVVGWDVEDADVEASTKACTENGGSVVVEPRGLSGGRFCVVKDPGGSVAALYQP